MPLSTGHRMFVLDTPLGEDALLIHEMEGGESLSRPYAFKFKLVSDRADVRPDELIGKRATLRVETWDGDRFWTGIVSRFVRTGRMRAAEGAEGELFGYECDLVPWLWQLLQHEDSRIFQESSIPEIVEAIFADFGFSDYELQLSGEHPPLTYCVQYRETNYDFVSRLLERAGIYYFFRHEPAAEQLILTDNRDHNPQLDPAELPFHDEARAEDYDSITRLMRREQTHTGRFVLRDYDFERPGPGTELEVTVDTIVQLPEIANHERFVHPGGYVERGRGEALARVMMEAEEAGHETLDGESRVRILSAGHRFVLIDHVDDTFNTEYLLTSVRHNGTNNLGMGRPSGYQNSFSCIPHAVQYRSPLATPRARAHGPQTAVVVGPAGEEIHTDRYGRVKVKFRWDRAQGADDKSSCWLRVAQMWAGRQWGTMFVPRIGMEVLVDFLEGDPDQPIVVGCLYNGENMPPYELPAEATKSTFKTYSCKGGGGFNELRFEDRKGSEQLFVHAERNQDNRVENDSLEWIGKDRHLIVEGDQLEEVGGDKHLAVKGDRNEKVEGTVSLNAGVDLQQKVGVKHALDAGMEIHLKAGVNLVLESGASLTLKVGSNFINLNPAGVFIQGTMVMLNAGGSAGSGAGCAPTAPKAPAEADKAKPGEVTEFAAAGSRQTALGPQAATLTEAAKSGVPFCEKCEAARKAREAEQA
ncbi:type VI secretion system tip protein VgrG [Luteimonas sp. SJ-92]|uniref:Type VI secretion system tip protein VgrG n=1 Tax=Luteimonas salinisoli TaxID=2752307 RepID=A0A853JGR9_9GAMM|nr:type VI secretion system tip protein VgrG [Luteimonas salinisoli]NZA28576.1 type VI secretion system tip protein VgrG [Luteimonas salinisoli]